MRGEERVGAMRRSVKAGDAGEALLGPRLSPWLPEAGWEWQDRVVSNPWPCELLPLKTSSPPNLPLASDEQPS